MRLAREGITKYIGLLLVVGALAAIAGTGALLLRFEQQQRTDALRQHGLTLARVLARAASSLLEAGRLEDLQRLLQTLHDPAVRFCAVVDTTGRIVAHSDARRRGQPYTPAPAARPASPVAPVITAVQGEWHVAMPLLTAEGYAGTVQLRLRAPTLEDSLRRLAAHVAPLALVIFALVPVVYYGLRLLLRPLHQLSARLAALPTAEAASPLALPAAGEVGELVRQWNEFVRHVQASVSTLKEANFELELTASVVAYEKRRLELVLDSLSDALVITDAAARVVFANKITARLLQVPREQLHGRLLPECCNHPELRALLQERHELGQTAGVRSREVRFEAYPSETFRATLAAVVDGDEQLVGYFLLVRNITQQKLAEQARSEFISAVAHELKNPLSTIKSYVELLTNQVIEDRQTTVEFYNTINDETDRMTRLIDNLLSLSKIELGLLQVKPSRVRLKQLLADCVQAVESQAVAKGITLRLQLADKLSAIDVDKDLLGVVVLNLLSNALKYTPAGGEVTLLAEESEEEVRIEVRDTGIGIAEEDLPHIFERFYRGRNGEKTPGSGLGLALAQQIAQLHGGTLTVSSQPQQGSQFTLILPRAPHPSPTTESWR
ncbi:MAG: hypothetical protein KatS3mg131_0124 [Candidatus Tectimicrobiota bacterium]|nr:MAG: hypothetical protein KatS3mg131_0124 [Candidatus Tectomicrobia bacterium]